MLEERPDHGDAEKWAELTGEETRCLIGLKNYYTTFMDKPDIEALELAWIDLKHEFERLRPFTWYK